MSDPSHEPTRADEPDAQIREALDWCDGEIERLTQLGPLNGAVHADQVCLDVHGVPAKIGAFDVLEQLSPPLFPESLTAPFRNYNTAMERLGRLAQWCRQHTQQSEEWEFAPGQFRYQGGPWHPLPGVTLALLTAFAQAPANTLTEEQIMHVTTPNDTLAPKRPPKISSDRVYGRLSELRLALRSHLNLPANSNPLPRIGVRLWKLTIPSSREPEAKTKL